MNGIMNGVPNALEAQPLSESNSKKNEQEGIIQSIALGQLKNNQMIDKVSLLEEPQASRLVTPTMSDEQIKEIDTLLDKIASEKQKPFVDSMLPLFVSFPLGPKGDKDKIHVLKFLIVSFPMNEGERKSVIEYVLSADGPKVDTNGKHWLLRTIARVPKEQRASVMSAFHLLDTSSMDGEQKRMIIRAIAELPLERQMPTIKGVKLLSLNTMSVADTLILIKTLGGLALNQMDEIVSIAEKWITKSMTFAERQNIILAIIALSPEQREAIDDVFHFITPETPADERCEILKGLGHVFIVSTDECSVNFGLRLHQFCEKKGFPKKFKILGSPGFDMGGVERHVMEEFTSRLCKTKGLPMIACDNEQYIPMIGPGDLEQQKKLCQVLGILFSQSGHGHITIGHHFHPVLFQLIYHLLTEEDYNSIDADGKNIPWLIQISLVGICLESYMKLSSKEIFEFQNPYFPLSEQIQKWSGYGPFDREKFLDGTYVNQMIQAAVLIAKQMISLGLENWKKCRGGSFEEFLQNMQGGVLSKEGVLQALAFNDKTLKSATFLETWITNAKEEDLVRFVFATTGSKRLRVDDQITVKIHDKEKYLPQFCTCVKRIELGKYPDQETFNKQLETSLTHGLREEGGFQME